MPTVIVIVVVLVIGFVIAVARAGHVSGPPTGTAFGLHHVAPLALLGHSRRGAYRLLSTLNTLHSIEQGRLPQRLVRKFVYKTAFQTAGRVCRLLKVQR
jgi:hypothetical protein